MKYFLMTLILFFSNPGFSQKTSHWVEIGEGTFQYKYDYPYKVSLSIPYGERSIEDFQNGLLPMRFIVTWLPTQTSKEKVQSIFLRQLESQFDNKDNFKLSQYVIQSFLKELPSTQAKDIWMFDYYPDIGTKLFIDKKIIHHLIGSQLNRSLIQSWLSHSPVLTSNLFYRLLKLHQKNN